VTGSAVDALKGKTIPRGRGIAGWIAENSEPLIVEDVRRDRRFDEFFDRVADFETRSIIGVPLKTQNDVFGVIELINTLEARSFTLLLIDMCGFKEINDTFGHAEGDTALRLVAELLRKERRKQERTIDSVAEHLGEFLDEESRAE
jgi:predicted signal transduction protein with EAL and GGDEF domain